MGVDPITLGISSALSIGGMLASRHNNSFDPRAAQQRYMDADTSAHLTPEDQAFAESLRQRASRRFGAAETDATDNINRRFSARGGGRSPAQEAAIGSAQQRLGAQLESNEGGIEGGMYNVLRGREAFNRQRAHDIFSSDISTGIRNSQLGAAQDAAFWNSIGGVASDAADAWGFAKGGTTPKTQNSTADGPPYTPSGTPVPETGGVG